MFKRKLEDGSCNSDSVQHLVADVSTVKFAVISVILNNSLSACHAVF